MNDLVIPRDKGAEKIKSVFSHSEKSREFFAAR